MLWVSSGRWGLTVAVFGGVMGLFGTVLHFQQLMGADSGCFGGVLDGFGTTSHFQRLMGADSGWFWGVTGWFGTILCS